MVGNLPVIAPTIEAEAALRQLNARIREYRASPAELSDSVRFLSVGLSYRDANAVVDLAAIAEAYCVARLAAGGVTKDVNTWDKRKKGWKKTGIDLANCPVWNALMGYVEARNAIQHGLGKLTDQQLDDRRRTDILRHLTAASIYRNGDTLFLNEDDIAKCERTCATFIRWLDLAATSATSPLM